MTKRILSVLGALICLVGAYTVGYNHASLRNEAYAAQQRDIYQQTVGFTSASVDVADRALNYALKYQETLDLCLKHLQLTKGYPVSETYGTPVYPVGSSKRVLKAAYNRHSEEGRAGGRGVP